MVMGHVGFGDIFSKWIHSFHMPIFFIISGFLYRRKNCTFKSFFQKKAKHLLLPYFAFWFINMITRWVAMGKAITVDNLYHCFIEPTDGMSVAGALWFIVALFVAEMIFFFSERYILNKAIRAIFITILSVFGCIAIKLLPFRLPFALDAAFVGCGLMYIGYLFRNTKLMNALYVNSIIAVSLFCVFSLVVLEAKDINMRTGKYGIVPLFWVNAIVLSVAIFNISRWWMEICKKISSKLIHRITDEICYIGKSSMTYLCLNTMIIAIGETVLSKVIPISNALNAWILLMFVMSALRICDVIIQKTKLRVLLGK